MKINRLLEITILLMSKGTITAKELAERYQVSTRTIYRDIEALSSAGVPVVMTKGYGGGISLLENYTLNKTLLSSQESESLLLALKTLQATKYPEIDLILDKLRAVFKDTQETDWVDVDFSDWGSTPNDRNKFNELKMAILHRQVLKFDYVNAAGERSSRYVEPVKLFFKANAWYLIAYCRKRSSFRIFRISRIKNVQTTIEIFQHRTLSETERASMQGYGKQLVKLRLRFQAKVLNRLYDDFDDTLIVKSGDGTLEVNINAPEDEWLYGYVMSFGSSVEVLEPEGFRQALVERMKQALKIYAN